LPGERFSTALGGESQRNETSDESPDQGAHKPGRGALMIERKNFWNKTYLYRAILYKFDNLAKRSFDQFIIRSIAHCHPGDILLDFREFFGNFRRLDSKFDRIAIIEESNIVLR
jgi:hypothetical protein